MAIRPSALLVVALVVLTARASAAASCESLKSLTLPKATVTSSQLVAAGTFMPPGGRSGGTAFANLPAFCRVQATLTPSADSDIKIEVWLPASGWNGNFQAVGNRGWGGTIMYPALAAAVAAGYAAVSTDTGHSGNNAAFLLGHPEKLIDSGYRAAHEMTVQAKSIIAAFYGNGPRISYWNGCSLGGRQGLSEAQRYPADYQGIVVGDVANNLTDLYTARLAVASAVHKSEASYIPPAKYAVIHNAVLEACDGKDGVKDRVLEDPRACTFDPQVLACTNGDAANCLTAPQVDAARAIYAPTMNPKSGAVLSRGYKPGSELGWAAVAGPQPENNSVEMFKYMVYKNADWDWKTFDFAHGFAAASDDDFAPINAVDPNLTDFFNRGGKLLMYHGWADPQTPPENGIDYYNRALARSGKNAASSIRLFMVPGMGHCEGGDGTDTFDKMTPLADWVERGKAPARIEASHLTNDVVDRTRPLCPLGQVAKYRGAGSTDEAANFVCAAR